MTVRSPLERGLLAVQRKDWHRARSLLAGQGGIELSVQGLEGLALACWWLDDGPGFIASREALFRLHHKQADTLAAARVAVRISWDLTIVGREAALAWAWLDRARALFGQGDGSLLDSAFCNVREAALVVNEDAPRALDLARAVRADAQAGRAGDLEVLALVCEGEALFALGDIEPALRLFEEATLRVCLGEATDPLAVTRASCTLLVACADVRDYARAATWLPRVVESSAEIDGGTMAIIGRCAAVPLFLGRGLWREAAAAIEDGMNHFATGNDPWERSLLAAQAELRFRQGRFDEARALVYRAEPDRRCQLIRALLALESGEPARAMEHASASLRQAGPRVFAERAAAYELLAIATAQRRLLPAARDARGALERLARRANTPSLLGALRRADAAIALAEGDDAAAIDALLDAVDHYRRAGATYEASASRAELARTLTAVGRLDEAEHHRNLAALARAEVHAPGHAGCPLTPREIEVLNLVARGRSNPQIAAALVVSPHTVHRHVSNILGRLNCPTRAAAVARATEHGWLEAGASRSRLTGGRCAVGE
jgi:DNA-binding NarL/FixJ family response regulator